MKHITTSKGTFIFVEVPDHAIPDLMHVDENGMFIADYCTLVWSGNPPEPDHDKWTTLLELQLPKESQYQLICTTSNATDEQAAMVVDTHLSMISDGSAYKNYSPFDAYEGYIGYNNPLHSLKSFLIAYELHHTKNYAILKQI